MAKLDVRQDELWIGERLRSRSLLHVLLPGSTEDEVRAVPIAESAQGDGLFRYGGAAHGFAGAAVWTPCKGIDTDYWDVELRVSYQGEAPLDCALRVSFDLVGSGRPTWLIPGAFYRENRLPDCSRIYPRYDWAGGDPAELVANAWSFRSDRTALPAVFGWTDEGSAALATAEGSAVGLTGLGFVGNAEQTALHLTFPYREEPAVFLGPGQPGQADRPTYRFTPGQQVVLHFRVWVGGADPHAYAPFVRELYRLDRPLHPLKPWIGLRQAAELTAHGLYRWHYKPDLGILCETAAFDREGGSGDRLNMHVGWVSGTPWAHALLTYGWKERRPEYVEAAIRVMDKIAAGIAPAGIFWGEWRNGRGWSQGWTPNKGWVHARTISEATLFMIRALRFEQEHGEVHEAWLNAIHANLAYIARIQREDGALGAYYHAETGEVMAWDGAGGLLWIAALLEGADLFEEGERFRAAATRAGHYYRRFVDEAFIYGAPEDVHLCPTSEDGYNAIIAFLRLYEEAKEREWLDLAARAADWTMTFRWTYNLSFPERTMLGQFDFRSRGADHASPSNQHLHNYGLICLPEMLRLWRYTGDDYYLERTQDNLACFLQFIAREDGDFNAYRGMVSERYYNTNCFQPKGMLLTLSHAWCVGVILYAAQAAALYEGLWSIDLGLPQD